MSIQLIATPTYEDLFGEKPPRFEDLVAETPLNHALEYGCLVSSVNFWCEDEWGDYRILQRIVGRVDLKKLILLKNWLESLDSSRQSETGLFAPHYTVHYFHLCILSCSQAISICERTPESDLLLFKALILSAHVWNEQYGTRSDSVNQIDFFRKNTWAIDLSQMGSNSRSNEVVAVAKGWYFLNFIREQPALSMYVDTFLKAYNEKSEEEYMRSIMRLFTRESNAHAPMGIWDANHTHRTFLNSISLNRSDYSKEYTSGHRSFSGIKSHPVVKVSDDHFLILDWSLLIEKLYDGVVRSFYQSSGISELPKFQTFHDFRRYLALDMIERKIFRIAIDGIFPKNHAVKIFDDEGKEGFFDALVIDGKSLFVFEIKDSLFPSNAIDSRNYEAIRKELDKKYNADDKGTGQLVRGLRRMRDGEFSSILLPKGVPNCQKLTVYPILLYTDKNFGTSGTCLYLQEQFQAKLSPQLSASFKHIYPLTFCSLDYFLENVDLLSKPKGHLSQVIAYCSNQLKIRRKKFERTDDLKHMIQLNESFERISYGFIGRSGKRDGFVEKVLSLFNLTHKLAR